MLNILHLEDNALDASLVEDYLNSEDIACNVHLVDEKEGFENALTTLSFDFIFADHTLPNFDALQALIIAKKLVPHTPFILVSGTVGEEFAIECLKAGATDYVLKNRLSRLIPAIQRATFENEEAKKRQKAEKTIVERELHFRSLIENSSDIITLTDEQGIILYKSPSVYRVLGYKPQEIIGKPIFDFIHPFDIEIMVEILNNIQKIKYEFLFELRLLHKNQTWVYLEFSANDMFDNNAVNAMVLNSRDITLRKIAENELREAKAMLEIKVQERTAQLKHSNKELLGFAHATAHDLSEPLRTINSFAQLIKMYSFSQLDKNSKEYLKFILNAGKNMETLINDLLTYSQLTSNQNDHFESLDFIEIIDIVRQNLARQIKDTNVLIQYDNLPSDVWGVRTKLVQLVQNLISNALKFRKKDKQPILTIFAEEKNNYWAFSITDNGIGIPQKYIKEIFEMYRRLHGKNIYRGSGIGLASCKQIVQQHGGKIYVTSEVEVGSTFYFSLDKK